jgi:cation transport ATPase
MVFPEEVRPFKNVKIFENIYNFILNEYVVAICILGAIWVTIFVFLNMFLSIFMQKHKKERIIISNVIAFFFVILVLYNYGKNPQDLIEFVWDWVIFIIGAAIVYAIQHIAHKIAETRENKHSKGLIWSMAMILMFFVGMVLLFRLRSNASVGTIIYTFYGALIELFNIFLIPAIIYSVIAIIISLVTFFKSQKAMAKQKWGEDNAGLLFSNPSAQGEKQKKDKGPNFKERAEIIKNLYGEIESDTKNMQRIIKAQSDLLGE